MWDKFQYIRVGAKSYEPLNNMPQHAGEEAHIGDAFVQHVGRCRGGEDCQIIEHLIHRALTLTGVDPPVLTKTDPLLSQRDCVH
jgi:hypothetical protein